jgi:hypothetical protein
MSLSICNVPEYYNTKQWDNEQFYVLVKNIIFYSIHVYDR